MIIHKTKSCAVFFLFPTFFYFEFIQWTLDRSDHEGVAEDKEFALQTVKRKYIFMKFMWKLISTTERKKGKKKYQAAVRQNFHVISKFHITFMYLQNFELLNLNLKF